MYNFLINEAAVSVEPTVSRKSKDSLEFIAVMQEADKPNRNGRIYYKTVLEQALAVPYVQERLRTKSFYVEAGHPSDPSVQRQMTIDQRNIAAIVKEFWWEGNLLKARLETANTAIGRDFKGLIEQGSRVAFSLRAQGNVHRDAQLNATIVEAPIQIATYDWVVNPSHDKAFLESICEATQHAFFRSDNYAMALTESTVMFNEGKLTPINEEMLVTIDYAKNYHKKIKPLSEMYLYDPKDKVKIDGKFAILENANVNKKVVLEDYILKDVRHKIRTLGEEGLSEANANQVKSDSGIAQKIKSYLSKYAVKFTWRINKHIAATERLFRGNAEDVKLALVAMPYKKVKTNYGVVDAREGTRIILFTDKEISIYGKGILTGGKATTIRLDRINDIIVDEGIVWAKVRIDFKQANNALESSLLIGRINKNAVPAVESFIRSHSRGKFTKNFHKDDAGLNESVEDVFNNEEDL